MNDDTHSKTCGYCGDLQESDYDVCCDQAHSDMIAEIAMKGSQIPLDSIRFGPTLDAPDEEGYWLVVGHTRHAVLVIEYEGTLMVHTPDPGTYQALFCYEGKWCRIYKPGEPMP